MQCRQGFLSGGRGKAEQSNQEEGLWLCREKWVEVQSGLSAASGRPLALAVPVIGPPQAQVPTAVSCNALKGSKWFVPGTAHQALFSGLHPAL